MSTSLSAPEQDSLVLHKLEGGLGVLNCPSSIPERARIMRPFFVVRDVEELDPTDKRDRPDPEDERDVPASEKRRVPIHSSERRRIMVPHVFALSGKPIEQEIRELADTGDRDGRLPNGGLRWKLFGTQH